MSAREQGVPEVHPRDFWVAITGITILLIGREAYYLQTGKAFEVSEGVLTVFLSLVWLVFFCNLCRKPRSAVTVPYALALAGYTLSVGDRLIPQIRVAGEWTKGIGLLLTILSLLTLYTAYFNFGKPKR